ncbi:hypothetical protein [Nocardia sp. NRRL S-836]|uniref:hypothetical protein n=1 Tax=Nocardia sp. NRRL S-836 TaxID=1519492 RepID=UPI0006AF213E|nr:hypothetical protein [Nocardia sp. NRRL S-836]KOV81819.1 hypothetical protein ADL03_27010 [Nocardia sp. NRRL S-836]
MTTVKGLTRGLLTLAAATACLTALPAAHAAATVAAQDKPKQITLGDLDPRVDAKTVGAPYDPCALGWGAFPAKVRPETDKKPRLRAPSATDVFRTGCRYDNGELPKNTDPNGKIKNFFALVVWAKPGEMKTAQADQPNSQPHTFGGKAGLIISGTNKTSKEPLCTGIIPLANGTAAIAITNGRFGIDTCSVVKHVGEVIAGKTP